MNSTERITHFLFEIGTMRKLLRMHRQTLLTDDLSDNIASHSYRVAMIGWFIAKEEKLDPYKVVMMCLLHDLDEAAPATITGYTNVMLKYIMKRSSRNSWASCLIATLKNWP